MMNTGAIIQDLIDWIDNHLDSRLDIDTVARRAGYSKWHLQRIFKEHTGQPLGEYIRAKSCKVDRTLSPQQRADPERGDCPSALTPSSPSTAASSASTARRPASGAGVSAALLRRHLVSDPHDRGGSVLTRPMIEFAAFADGIELPACDIVNGP